MASDREILAHVRKSVGIQPGDLSDGEILKEIERGKREINREIRETVARSGQLNVYELGDAAEDALKSYVSFRAKGKLANPNKGGKGVGRGNRTPKSVSEMRRTDLPDPAMNQMRDETVAHIRRMKDNGD